jgi:hypothetical protein
VQIDIRKILPPHGSFYVPINSRFKTPIFKFGGTQGSTKLQLISFSELSVVSLALRNVNTQNIYITDRQTDRQTHRQNGL